VYASRGVIYCDDIWHLTEAYQHIPKLGKVDPKNDFWVRSGRQTFWVLGFGFGVCGGVVQVDFRDVIRPKRFVLSFGAAAVEKLLN
jgi:hypothetical protein